MLSSLTYILRLLPLLSAFVVLSVLFYILKKRTRFGTMANVWRNVIIGVAFGAAVVLEKFAFLGGVADVQNYLGCINVAPLCAGIFFSAPSALIAGFTGAFVQWIIRGTDVETTAMVVSAVMMILSGCYAAMLRKLLFNDKRPKWPVSFAIGTVFGVFHSAVAFVVYLREINLALDIVQKSTLSAVTGGLVLMLISLILSTLSKKFKHYSGKHRHLTDIIQNSILCTVLIVYAISLMLSMHLESVITKKQLASTLSVCIEDVISDIELEAQTDLQLLAEGIAQIYGSKAADCSVSGNDIEEVSYADENGIIVSSTNAQSIGCSVQELAQGMKPKKSNDGSDSTSLFVGDSDDVLACVEIDDGFVLIHYSRPYVREIVRNHLINIPVTRTIGKSGYVLISTSKGVFIGENAVSSGRTLSDFGIVPEETGEGVFNVSYDGTDYCAMLRQRDGFYILALYPESEAMMYRDIALALNTFMMVLIYAVLFSMIYLLMERRIIRRIQYMAGALKQIAAGNLDVAVDVRDNVEFENFSDDINRTVDELKQHIEDAKARIDQELTVAKNIQYSALPSVFPAYPGRKEFEIFARMDTAKEVGGDFYDFYMTDENTLNFLVADVSGKGIPAAMFMMRAKTELKGLAEYELTVSDAFTAANAHLCEGNDADMFVTVWMGQLDIPTGVVTYANAGHNPPLLRRKDGSFVLLREKAGFVLAGMEDMCYKSRQLQLEPGDTIFLYTDGVTEAMNAAGELYGEERLLRCLNGVGTDSAEDLCQTLKQDLNAFVGDAAQFDDITMLALCYRGVPKIPEMHFDNAAIEDIEKIQDFMEDQLTALGCPLRLIYKMRVAVDEIYSNIVKFAYGTSTGPATVQISVENGRICLLFIDEGIPYNPVMKEDPDTTLSAEDRPIGGLGIYMVKKSMDEMTYMYKNDRNMLYLYKNWPVN